MADGPPLALCLGAHGGSGVKPKPGTQSETMVTAFDRFGRPYRQKLGGYGGCLRTFADAPFSRGNCWPTWCPDCESGKSNAKAKAITALQRRDLPA